ncbi:MAG: hypothetical protein H6620_10955 [Halobacteriovoraceae bacterium]|nr:hypothetical protein [Halobacteriovoraceae bacterium]
MTVYPGKEHVIEISKDLQSKYLSYISIRHRRMPGINYKMEGERVTNSGYTSILVREKDSGDWYYWAGSSSSKWGGKFPESTYDFEEDNLYEWMKVGFVNQQTSERRKGKLQIEQIKIVNTGVNPIQLKELIAEFLPEENEYIFDDLYFSKADFGDFYSLVGRRYGQEMAGLVFRHPNAKTIEFSQKSYYIKKSYSDLTLELPTNRNIEDLLYIEIIGGDKINGQTGSATALASTINNNHKDVWESKRIPPLGSVRLDSNLTFGDSVLIEVGNHHMFINGLRLVYKK